MRTCRKRGETKPPSAYYAGQRRSRCIECMREDCREYAKRKAEQVAAQQRRWREANRARANATSRSWKRARPLLTFMLARVAA